MPLTRAQIEDHFDVDTADIIRSPGKFEGESVMAPYFYDLFLDGMADEDEGPFSAFTIDDHDRKEFPGLIPDNATTARLHHHESGFITLSFH